MMSGLRISLESECASCSLRGYLRKRREKRGLLGILGLREDAATEIAGVSWGMIDAYQKSKEDDGEGLQS